MEEELEEQEDNIWVKVCLHPLSNIEITKYLNYDPRFNGIFLKNDLPRIEDGAYVINFSDKTSKRNTLGFIIYWQKYR